MSDQTATLIIETGRETSEFSAATIRKTLGNAVIEDVSRLEAKRSGSAIALRDLLGATEQVIDASFVTLHSADGFSASLPLEIASAGLIIFCGPDGHPLADSAGGPFRFLFVDAAQCGTAEADACANVKGLVRIELSHQRGRDSRGRDS